MIRHLPTHGLRRWARSGWGRVAISAATILLGALGWWAVREAMLPRVYFISEVAFSYYRSDKVPDPIIALLKPLAGKVFVDKHGLTEAMRSALGDAEYRVHQGTLERRIRTRHCWPTTSTQPIRRVRDSRGHPLHGRFTAEVVIPQAQLPPVTTQLEFLPGGEGVLTLGKFGHLVWFGGDWKARVGVQVPGVYEGGEDQGALGLAADPAFARNRFVYVANVDAAGTHNVVRRLTLSGDPAAVLASAVDVLRLRKDNNAQIHGIGSLRFTTGGVLLVQIGDPAQNSQSWGAHQGKVLGIVPKAGPQGGYDLPPATWGERLSAFLRFGSPMVLAGGLRAPFTATLWRGYLIMGDVGGNGPWSTEEINVYSRPGDNFGWGQCEDSSLHADFKPPAIAYVRNDAGASVDDPQTPDTVARSVIVGTVYDGFSTDRYAGTLTRRLLYGDFYLGFVRGARLNDRAEVEDDVFLMHLPNLTSMRVGPDGYVYGVTAIGDKGLFRLKLK